MTSVNNRPEILSKLGVGSGLDTSALIESLVEAEIAGPKEQLEQRESDFSARISAFSQIKNNLKVFKDNLEIIQSNNSLGYQGTTSDSTIATFSANGNSAASAINSQLTVSSLATAHTLTGPSLSSPNKLLEQEHCRLHLEHGPQILHKEEGSPTLQMVCQQFL